MNRHLLLCPLLVCLIACDQAPPPREHVRHADDAIIGGIVDEGHPYVVALGDGAGPWCTGTLISERTVLTAAHCTGGVTTVYFGTFLNGPPGQINVLEEVIHPDWQFQLIFSDLALLRLAQPTGLQPAPLLRKTLNNSPTYMGPDWTFVGYGIDNAVNGSGFGTKRVAAFPFTQLGPIMTPDQQNVSEHYIYYDNIGQSGCQGDSGGPSFFVDGAVEKQGAVTSWGSQLCDVFGVYSRADKPYVDDFIQPTLNQFEPNNACRNDGSCNESCNTQQVVDPDCHVNHCTEDGVCAIACVNPVDPDCAAVGVDHCGEDGVCDPACAEPDPDCGGGSSTVASSSSSVASVVSSSSSGGGGAGGASSAGGTDTPGPAVFDDDEFLYGRGCGGCLVGADSGAPRGAWWLVALGVVPWLRRRRRQL